MQPGRSRKRDKTKTRAERQEDTRRSLMDAAIRIVGEEGYAAASIAKITAEAQVAHGTFYSYFESRDDILRSLLPELGRSMLDKISRSTLDQPDPTKREYARVAAYFEFIKENRGFYRILKEAETFFPDAYDENFRTLAQSYVRAFGRALQQGLMPGFDHTELEPLAVILMGARDYLTAHYLQSDSDGSMPPQIINAYMKLLVHGLFGRLSNESGIDAGEARG